MAYFLIFLLSVGLFFLPLQWQVPGLDIRFPASDPWNGPTILLCTVQIIFYGYLLITRRKIANQKVLIGCFAFTGILLALYSMQHALEPSAARLGQLLVAVWSVPMFVWLADTLGQHRYRLLLSSVATLFALWGIGQFVVQSDFGLYLLGETQLSETMSGVAKFSVITLVPEGTYGIVHKVVRAYGPFAHANSLSGVLVLGFLVVLATLRRNKQFVWWVLAMVLWLGILVTFSRAAYVAACFMVVYFLIANFAKSRKVEPLVRTYFWYFILTTLLFMPFWIDRTLDPLDRGISERVSGIQAAQEIILRQPWWGTGIGKYEAALAVQLTQKNQSFEPWEVAPVHSVPSLLVAELGAIGTFSFILFALWLYQGTKKAPTGLVLGLLPLLLFDHYFITQTAPLVWLLACLVALRPQDSSDSPLVKQPLH